MCEKVQERNLGKMRKGILKIKLQTLMNRFEFIAENPFFFFNEESETISVVPVLCIDL